MKWISTLALLTLFGFAHAGCSTVSDRQTPRAQGSVDPSAPQDPSEGPDGEIEIANPAEDPTAPEQDSDSNDDGDNEGNSDGEQTNEPEPQPDPIPESRFQIMDDAASSSDGVALKNAAKLESPAETAEVLDLEIATEAKEMRTFAVALIREGSKSYIEVIQSKSGVHTWSSYEDEEIEWHLIEQHHNKIYVIGFRANDSKTVIREYEMVEDFFGQPVIDYEFDESIADFSFLDTYDKSLDLYLHFDGSNARLVDLEKPNKAPVDGGTPDHDRGDDQTTRIGAISFEVQNDGSIKAFRVSDDSELVDIGALVNSSVSDVALVDSDSSDSGFLFLIADGQGNLRLVEISSPRMIDAKKYYSYPGGGSLFQNQEISLSQSFSFRLPQQLFVSEGNSGNHKIDFEIDSVVCQYKGATSQNKPKRGSGDFNKGFVYKFDDCSDGSKPGDAMEASSIIKFTVNNGNTRLSPTRVDVLLDEI